MFMNRDEKVLVSKPLNMAIAKGKSIYYSQKCKNLQKNINEYLIEKYSFL